MRQTLFHIPHDAFGVALFGFDGLLLWIWVIASVGILLWLIRRQGWNSDTRSYVPVILVVAAALAIALPFLEAIAPDGTPIGLPIRGYGVMMLAGFAASVGLACWRARRMGIHPDVILSLAFWMFISGIAGARLFYVVEYWHGFSEPSLAATILKIFKFTEGGLVVYGSAIGAGIGVVWFMRVHQLPLLAMADLIAPFLMVGLSLGRIGCLLNGCCYGGICEEGGWGLRFPAASPPYAEQLETGALVGAVWKRDGAERVVESVRPNSDAERAGIRAGDRIAMYRAPRGDEWERARSESKGAATAVRLITDAGKELAVTFDELPASSRPVHATQIYSSINAALLFVVLWCFYPFRQRDGQVFALLLTLYPISRFALEMIRIDEASAFGTGFSISQLISLPIVALAIGLWVTVARLPARSALPRGTERAGSDQKSVE